MHLRWHNLHNQRPWEFCMFTLTSKRGAGFLKCKAPSLEVSSSAGFVWLSFLKVFIIVTFFILVVCRASGLLTVFTVQIQNKHNTKTNMSSYNMYLYCSIQWEVLILYSPTDRQTEYRTSALPCRSWNSEDLLLLCLKCLEAHKIKRKKTKTKRTQNTGPTWKCSCERIASGHFEVYKFLVEFSSRYPTSKFIHIKGLLNYKINKKLHFIEHNSH